MLLHVFIWAQLTKDAYVAKTKIRVLRDVAEVQNSAARKFGGPLKRSSPLEEQKTTMECTVAIEKSPQNSLVFTVFTVFSISKQKSIAVFSPTA